ncbi:hypothetical protein TVAG_007660 [Trichomonas vaginalis G3]|uniref:Chromo domain-containing protein n=1 Tax=Trichomonas vaginalis (strain ATCC PRA-98 / G3) TaxID=412133 RepID=A2EYW9_TRIV3|nr:hypothetical protein TVAGG3_0153060 [Trichomonas vaginalis G3]EAY02131.1 hypothetical protein TVAG_007660 [Trichomonas vaginalis G3]KAI5547398.1 hypothetical protein TVAGG3_0153060 [Trichomonas vaginalis G3]|eukprot:XP_001314510.1 hypothetical protein [Trichomonas vaginalis G3]
MTQPTKKIQQILLRRDLSDIPDYLIKWDDGTTEWISKSSLFFYKKETDNFDKTQYKRASEEKEFEAKPTNFEITDIWEENDKLMCGGKINDKYYSASYEDCKRICPKNLIKYYKKFLFAQLKKNKKQ